MNNMLNEIILAIVQSATEFFPVSSSGHLALISSIISQPNIFLFTVLNFASLLAVIIFTRKEIIKLLYFDDKSKKKWIFLIIGTIPAGAFGYFFKDFIETQFNSLPFIGCAFLITGLVLFFTKNVKPFTHLGISNSFAIGVAQMFAIFPGISRSGMTISSAKFLGLDSEEAFKFSFLLFIPVSIGAMILEIGEFYFNTSLVVSFIITFVLSLIFLNLLHGIITKNKFWIFSFYCFVISAVTFIVYFLK